MRTQAGSSPGQTRQWSGTFDRRAIVRTHAVPGGRTCRICAPVVAT